MQTIRPAVVNSGHHTSSLAVSFLSNDSAGQDVDDETQNEQVPTNLTYGLEKPVDADIITPDQLNSEINVEQFGAALVAAPAFNDAPIVPEPNFFHQPTLPDLRDAVISVEDSAGENSQASTQTRQDVQTRRKLRDMLKVTEKEDDLDDTQVVTTESLSAESVSIFNSRTQLQFTQAKIDELKMRKRAFDEERALREASSSTMGVDAGRDTVKCQCGYNEEGEEMVSLLSPNNVSFALMPSRSVAIAVTLGNTPIAMAIPDQKTRGFQRIMRAMSVS